MPVHVVAEPANELEYVIDFVQPFLGPLTTFGMVLIFSVFLLIKQDDLRNRLFRLVGLDQLNAMTQALDDATRRVSRYLLMQFVVNAGFGALCGVGLYFIGGRTRHCGRRSLGSCASCLTPEPSSRGCCR